MFYPVLRTAGLCSVQLSGDSAGASVTHAPTYCLQGLFAFYKVWIECCFAFDQEQNTVNTTFLQNTGALLMIHHIIILLLIPHRSGSRAQTQVFPPYISKIYPKQYILI